MGGHRGPGGENMGKTGILQSGVTLCMREYPHPHGYLTYNKRVTMDRRRTWIVPKKSRVLLATASASMLLPLAVFVLADPRLLRRLDRKIAAAGVVW